MTSTITTTLTAPFPVELAGKLWRWLNSPRQPNFDDFGPRTAAEFYDELQRRMQSEVTWAIRVDGEIVGYLGFRPNSEYSGQFHGMVLAPEHRNQGIGRLALEQAISELAKNGLRKLMVMTYAGNDHIKSLFEGVGFSVEGRVAEATLREGKPLDMLMMGLLVRKEG